MRKGFEGWYFKHQKGYSMAAFIPGRAQSGAFVQMISENTSRYFAVPKVTVRDGIIHAGDCLFAPSGCRIRLPGVSGDIKYGHFTPLRSDIMGPFRFLPMECRHGVISMAHTLSGGLTVEGKYTDLDGGVGYIEKDSGTSFPRAYLWLQCNNFSEPCAVMASVAHIPFGKGSFTGCICALVYRGREYRFATYNGVHILAAEEGHLCLSRGKQLLEIDITPLHGGYPLLSPMRGQMSGVIRESGNADIRVRLWERGKRVLDLRSGCAAYERVPRCDGDARAARGTQTV